MSRARMALLLLVAVSVAAEARGAEALDASSAAEIEFFLETLAEMRKPETAARSCSVFQSLPGLSKGFFRRGADCTRFIDKNGEYGEWGRVIVSVLDQKDSRSVWFGDLPGMDTFPNFCPRWMNLTRSEKTHFWVWTFAAIAWQESTCRSEARARGIKRANGTYKYAVGLLQMEETLSDRKWREGACTVQSVKKPKENLECGMHIMEEWLKGREGLYGVASNGRISGGKNYWQELRKASGGTIGELIKQNPLCI